MQGANIAERRGVVNMTDCGMDGKSHSSYRGANIVDRGGVANITDCGGYGNSHRS